jgi:hypothetical protein
MKKLVGTVDAIPAIVGGVAEGWLRHTFGTRLWCADAFTIVRLMGHSTVTVSQRYDSPVPEAVELAFERMTTLNVQRGPKDSPAAGDSNAAVMTALNLPRVPTNSPTDGNSIAAVV